MAMIYRKMGALESPWPGATPLVTGSVSVAPAAAPPSSGGSDVWGNIIRGATQLGVEITRAAGGAYDQETPTTYQPGTTPSGYRPGGIGGISTTTLLLLGGGALALYLIMSKKGSA